MHLPKITNRSREATRLLLNEDSTVYASRPRHLSKTAVILDSVSLSRNKRRKLNSLNSQEKDNISGNGSGLVVRYNGRNSVELSKLRASRTSAHDDLNDNIMKNSDWGADISIGSQRKFGYSQGKIPKKTRKMFELAGNSVRRRAAEGNRDLGKKKLPPPMIGMTMGHGIIA